ncbi:SDR family oxidoreductase [Candidatus Uabimicrobium amorphum]|uniref:Uncharacterized protein n=1 Tax=Uabimicrobium amorphum TaxID=2596890 RepID=A0A5S9ITB9_UABAM|nr:SDR family oxidoreductase [Candidatus Uabimicrobium amorphum]BBM87377.1 hypothetical protein UABAM_05786 [Candidatus Uabimicrobium amorphum]
MDEVKKYVYKVFTDVTKYPLEILDENAHFDEDLGINSGKQQQIFDYFINKYFPGNSDIFDEVHTIKDVIATIIKHKQQPSTQQPEQKVAVVRNRHSVLGEALCQKLRENNIRIITSSEKTTNVDFFIANPYTYPGKTLSDLQPNDWEDAFMQEVVSLQQELMEIAPRMIHGKILTFSSIAIDKFTANCSLLSAIHRSVETLTRYLCVELASYHIQVNCIATKILHENEAIGELDSFVYEMLRDETWFINGSVITADEGASLC